MIRLVPLSMLLLCLVTPRARAQVTTIRDLGFGTIVAGTTTGISKTGPNAAAWKIRGLLGIGGGFQLTLPTALTGPAGSMPITFSSSDGVYRINNSNPSGGVTFDPNNFVSIVLVVLSEIYVWLGASVSPPLNQPPGEYSGVVVLTTVGLL